MNCFDYGKEGDEIDAVSSRPDFGILCYPVVSFDKYMHSGSRDNLIGADNPDKKALSIKLSLELNVKDDTPPAFIWHTAADSLVPVQNSLMLADAMAESKVPFELVIFPRGRHGLALSDEVPEVTHWAGMCQNWLIEQGFGR
jgi:acetyl esterase/lipase